MMNEIPIFFAVDDCYAPYLDVAMRSLIQNASKDRNYRLIILHQKLRKVHQERLATMQREHFAIEFVAMEKGLECITDRTENRLRCDYFTMTIYFRIFIPEMFPQYDKGIYLDSDIVVPGDIAQLYDIALKNQMIGACADTSIRGIEVLEQYTKNAVGVDVTHYINSGVLLMNMAALRKRQMGRHFLELLTNYHVDTIAPDQDYLNAMCRGQIAYLDGGWDVMPSKAAEHKVREKTADGARNGSARGRQKGAADRRQEEDPMQNDIRLIHYNLFDKPWCYDGIPYAEYFWHYARQSPYDAQIRQAKATYSQEQKQSDAAAFARLMRKAAEIPDHTYTFHKLQKSGVKVEL